MNERSTSKNGAQTRKRTQNVANLTKATQPGTRQGVLQDQRENELVQLVENNLERGDLAPLVRFVFEGQDAPGQATKKKLEVAKKSNASGANEGLAAIKRVLKNVMVHEKSVITNWCARNAAQMRSALESVVSLQEQAGTMADELQTSHGKLRKSGKRLADNMRELHEAVKVSAFVSLAHFNVQQVLQAVQELVKAAKHLQNDDLHLALTIINALQAENEYLAHYPLPAKDKLPASTTMSEGEYELLNVMVRATYALLRAVRRQAQRNFHDWLASTREAARSIGERAVRRAASERAHEERLSQERKMLQGMLIMEKKDFKAAKALVLQFISQEDPAHGRSSIKQRTGGGSGAPPAMPQISRSTRFKKQSMRAGRNVDTDESANALSLLEDVDMSALHRCVLIHQMLGASDLKAFQEYYYEQRHLQLLSDLSPPSSILEHHRSYLAHIAGFFIMEEKVLQSTADLIMDREMRSLWSTAVSSIKSAMDSGFNEADNTASMLVMKDYLFLTASCLANHQFDSSTIMASLAQYRDRYHDLLNQEVAISIRILLRRDLKPLTIKSAEDVENMMTSIGLPQTFDPSAAPPKPPFLAPFSSALPAIIQSIESYIVASLQFLQGLLHSFELLATMREQRDRFITRLLLDLYSNHAAKLSHDSHETHDLRPLLLLSADAECLKKVLPSLDDYTIVVMRGSEEHAEEDLQLVARSLRRRTHAQRAEQAMLSDSNDLGGKVDAVGAVAQAVTAMQEKIDGMVQDALASDLRQCVRSATGQSWTPEEALPDTVSPYMQQLTNVLTDVFSVGAPTMGREALETFKRQTFIHVNNELQRLFTDSVIKSWNPHGIRRFASDMDLLLQFSGEQGCEQVFAQLDDLCSFLLREHWHIASNPEHLVSSYPNMNPRLLIAAMQRYEPVKLSYVDRLRVSSKHASRSEVQAFAKEVEASLAAGKLSALSSQPPR